MGYELTSVLSQDCGVIPVNIGMIEGVDVPLFCPLNAMYII